MDIKKLLQLAREAKAIAPEAELRKLLPKAEEGFMKEYVQKRLKNLPEIEGNGKKVLTEEVKMVQDNPYVQNLLKAREDIMGKMSPDLYKADVVFTPREQESLTNVNAIQDILERLKRKK